MWQTGISAATSTAISPTEWRLMTPQRRAELRAAKHARWATEGHSGRRQARRESRQDAAAVAQPSAGSPPPTPFRDTSGNPLYLSGLYRGASVFFIMSGPSLLSYDLSKLDRRGIVKFGVNNSPSVVRCHLWTHVDPTWKWHDAIWKDPQCLKFVCRRMARKHPVRERRPEGVVSVFAEDGPVLPVHMPGVLAYERNAAFDAANWLSEPSINWGNSKNSAKRNGDHRCLNVMPAALKIAYVLGFRFVYLLGADFDMRPGQPYAWGQTKDGGACDSNNNTYRILNDWFSRLQPHFLAANFYVFNCFERSGLRAFPFVDFNEAIDAATANIPQDPIDASGWYDGEGKENREVELTDGGD